MTNQYRGKYHVVKEQLVNAIKGSNSKKEVMEKLGFHTQGTHGYRMINYYAELYGVEIPEWKPDTSAATSATRIPLDDILKGEHPHYGTSSLGQRLIKEGIFERKCFECKIQEWHGKPVPIVLDHINGKSWDHRIENLRFLCRNCDGLTETFCKPKQTEKHKEKREKQRVKNHLEREKEMISKVLSGEISPRNTDDLRLRDHHLVEVVKQSGIDFSRSGWVTKLSPIINQKPQKVRKWMEKMMPEFLEKCYKMR